MAYNYKEVFQTDILCDTQFTLPHDYKMHLHSGLPVADSKAKQNKTKQNKTKQNVTLKKHKKIHVLKYFLVTSSHIYWYDKYTLPLSLIKTYIHSIQGLWVFTQINKIIC